MQFRETFPISWDEAVELIKENTVESLGKLGRDPSHLHEYQEAMRKVKEEFASIQDYMKHKVFKHELAVNQEGKKITLEPKVSTTDPVIVLALNDFPYTFEEGVEHHLLWSTVPLDEERIQAEIKARLPNRETAHFVNPVVLQSVASVWHCHIVSRAKCNGAEEV